MARRRNDSSLSGAGSRGLGGGTFPSLGSGDGPRDARAGVAHDGLSSIGSRCPIVRSPELSRPCGVVAVYTAVASSRRKTLAKGEGNLRESYRVAE